MFGCQEFLDFVSDQFCKRQTALAMNNKHPVNESKADVFHGHESLTHLPIINAAEIIKYAPNVA